MPYYDNFQDQDEQLSNPQGPQLAGASQVVGGGQAQVSNAPASKGPTSSERFQNLNAYLDANQGNQFGQKFADSVQADVAKGGQAQSQATGQFQNLANSGAVNQNTSLVNEAVSDPTRFINDQQKVDQFKQQRDAQYKGPNSYADAGDIYQKAAGATTKALDVAEKGQTEGGRFALLDNYFGRPEYSQGQKSLDNLLVSGNDNATQGLAQARKNAQDQMTAFQEQSKSLSDYASQKRGETENTQSYARSALGIDSAGNLKPSVSAVPTAPMVGGYPVKTIGKPISGRVTPAGTPIGNVAEPSTDKRGVLSGLYGELDSSAKAGAKKFSEQTADIQRALASKDFTRLNDEERALLGLSDHGALNTYGVDPSAFLSVQGGPSDYSISSVASSQQAQKLAALAQLAGIDPASLIDVNKAGTAPTNYAKLDLPGLSAASRRAADQGFQNKISAEGTGVPYSQGTYPNFTKAAESVFGVMPTNLKGQLELVQKVNNEASTLQENWMKLNPGKTSNFLKDNQAVISQARDLEQQLLKKLAQEKTTFENDIKKGANFKY